MLPRGCEIAPRLPPALTGRNPHRPHRWQPHEPRRRARLDARAASSLTFDARVASVWRLRRERGRPDSSLKVEPEAHARRQPLLRARKPKSPPWFARVLAKR